MFSIVCKIVEIKILDFLQDKNNFIYENGMIDQFAVYRNPIPKSCYGGMQ